MPLFTYSARNRASQLVRGTIAALSAQAARDSLKEMDLQAEELYEVSEQKEQLRPASNPTVMEAAPAEKVPVRYFPLRDTLRLYAGWLLSWYFLIFAFGSYSFLRALPFEIPLVSGLFQSPVIISFSFGAFLFLLLTDIHKATKGAIGTGVMLTGIWFGLLVLFRMNM